MKYLIKESQSEMIAEKIKKGLKEHFSDHDSICGFNVYVNDDEDYILSGAKFDIYIVFKTSYIKRFNETGKANLKFQMIKKVRHFIGTFIPVECFIGSISQDC